MSRFSGGILRTVAVVLAMSMFATSTARADDPVPGSQGTDTSLPATDSQVTVHGRGEFADLAITVNQTRNLNNQTVSITWTGGTPTMGGSGFFGEFLQIFQCWGDDDETEPTNPGPPPEQCEQGAAVGVPGGSVSGAAIPLGFATNRIISRGGWANYDPAAGHLDTVYNPDAHDVWRPFRAVNGQVIDVQSDGKFVPAQGGGNFWLNTFYNIETTNEIAGALTNSQGKGAELFQVVTGVESSALGCGQPSQPVAGGGKKTPQCWIVAVPRGTPAEENKDTQWDGDVAAPVSTSPVSPAAWQNRIAIPLEFNPVDSPCALGVDERRIAGSELALAAVTSWQPSLCTGSNLPPFSYSRVSDSTARQQLAGGRAGAAPMIAITKPLPATAQVPDNPVIYAPLSLSGVVIGFNIERAPTSIKPIPQEETALQGVRVAQLNLTPRLVAKLLTQSYRQAVTIGDVAPDYPWMAGNPAHMGLDPEFVKFNPEFDLLEIRAGRNFSGLELPAGSSDAASQVWAWVLADPEARAWLDGQPDEYGMRVNPVYATTAAANSNGVAFGDPLPDSFPKSDPYCYHAPPSVSPPITPSPLCGTDWLPYQAGFAEAAHVVRTAFDGARIVRNPNPLGAADVWKREIPQYLGARDMLAVTDTPSAARFGVQTARLSRAGDDGPNRSFIAADDAGLKAGEESMSTGEESQVLEPAPTAMLPGAYPLTILTYAAIRPLSLDEPTRADYSAFLQYAAVPGQVPGLNLGQLPRGYTPLPTDLQAQTLLAALLVHLLTPPDREADETTTTTTAPAATTTTTSPAATTAAPTTTAKALPPPADTPVDGANSAPPTTARRATPSPTPTTHAAPATTVAAPVTAPPATEPETSGEVPTSGPPATTAVPTTAAPTTTAAPALVSKALKIAKSRFAVPGLGVVAIGSALGALEISKRPRRRLPNPPADGSPPDDTGGDADV